MIIRIDHVSLAVEDYDGAVEFYTNILGAISQYHGTDNNLKYYWETFALGDLSRLEIIKPTGKGSFLENFFRKRGNGIHHLVLQTPDIKRAKEILEKNNIPYFGYNDYGERWKELFIHPKDAFGVLLQIAEFKADDWLDPSYGMPEKQKLSIVKNNEEFLLTFAHPGGGKVNLNLNREDLINLKQNLETLLNQ
ncbi:MAG: VOC family protein [Promethearchaeota archaeon]